MDIRREGDELVLRSGVDEYSRFNARTKRCSHRYAQVMCAEAAGMTADSRCLILGTGIGGMAVELADRTRCRIIAVDTESSLCEFVRRMDIPRTVVIEQDARAFVESIQSPSCFDVILVDIFIGNRMPSFVMEEQFLSRLKFLCRGKIIFNTIGSPMDMYTQRRMEQTLGKMKRWTGSMFLNCNIVLSTQ